MQPKKRLQKDVSCWVQEGDGRGVIGCLKDVWGDLIEASQNIAQAKRVALRLTKKDAFDLTSARVFLDDAQYQQRVVDLIKEYYPNRRAPNEAIKAYTVVHTMLLALTLTIFTLCGGKRSTFRMSRSRKPKDGPKNWGNVGS